MNKMPNIQSSTLTGRRAVYFPVTCCILPEILFRGSCVAAKRKCAFTLAEVLITLGIIGVVAALTMPTLIANHKKTVVETRLEKFYSAINQAVTRAELDYGDKNGWEAENTDEFFNKYLKNYLSYIKYENKRVSSTSNDYRLVYLPDGSGFLIDLYATWDSDGNQTSKTNGGHFIFCPNSKDCIDGNNYDKQGTQQFFFAFWPNESKSSFTYHKNKGVEPYRANWDGDMESLYTHSNYGCNKSAKKFWCTAIIQNNGWKIPKDYPLRF